MDGTVFDAWTRRRYGLAAGGLVLSLLTLGSVAGVTAKKKKRRKKKCGKRKKRCQGKCIKRSQCCRDSDCRSDAYCCEGKCVGLDSPCGGTCACFVKYGVCRQTVEGEVYCTRETDFPICAQCQSSEGCLADERCFPASCDEDVTAICRKVYVEF